MLSGLAFMIAIAQPLTLSIQPWTGADLQTTTTDAAKYRLLVTGRPDATVHLKASQVAQGWLAAFCTHQFCAPQHVNLKLPHSGQAFLQFELIRESDAAPKQSGATIVSDNGASVTVPAAFRQ
jgi:hypothetical protein